ncbi:MAG: ketoacyl-ACP synthase III [Clostridiales bacterium]|nr:ketoacyl-ACP synthase III [Clostridiales bacterium]
MNGIYLQIKGTGSYLPDQVLTNRALEAMVDTSDEWITDRTGIKERRLCGDTKVYEMAARAATAAMTDAGITANEIDAIIAATITPDCYTPSLSCLVQKELGADGAFCFDVNAACSGFTYALDVADSYIKAGKAKTVLIVASEAISRITDYTDRNTCVLFGDGAGAVVACASDTPGMIDCCLGASGAAGEVLRASAFAEDRCVKMNGKEVYKFAVNVNIKVINELLTRSGLAIGDVSRVVPHQANKRIISAVASKLDYDADRIFTNLEKYGNTSSASIPICLDEMNKGGLLRDGDKIILVGFGGGLTYGGALITWRR